MTEQELEKLFKTKLSSGNHPYNPAAWAAMENILNQKAVRGGAYFWRSAAAILAFALIIGSLKFSHSSQSPVADSVLSIEDVKHDQALPGQPVNTKAASQTKKPAALPDPENTQLIAVEEDAGEDLLASTQDKSETPTISSHPSQPAAIAGSEIIPALYPAVWSAEKPVVLDYDRNSIALVVLEMKKTSPDSRVSLHGLRMPVIIKQQSFRNSFQALYLKGGTVLNEAYNDRNMGVGFHIGVQYQAGLSKKVDVSAGLNYSRINKVGIHQQFDSTFYHFSSERIETEITGHQLNYLEMPLSLNWRFLPRHQIGVGAYASMLLSVSEDIEKRHYDRTGEMEVAHQSKEGKLSPYESYDLGFGLSYFYLIDRQLEIGVEIRRGLTDITKDTESVYIENHQNLNTRLSLRYRIL